MAESPSGKVPKWQSAQRAESPNTLQQIGSICRLHRFYCRRDGKRRLAPTASCRQASPIQQSTSRAKATWMIKVVRFITRREPGRSRRMILLNEQVEDRMHDERAGIESADISGDSGLRSFAARAAALADPES
eukprot:gene17531-biopygen395